MAKPTQTANEKALAKRDEDAPDTGQAVMPPSFSAEKPRVTEPMWFRLMQGMSPAVAEGNASPGDFYIDGIGVVEKPVTMVILMAARHRQLRDRSDEDDQPIICQSPDGVTGHGDPGGDCATCPMGKWGGPGVKPECTDIRSYVCYLPDLNIPVRWDLARTGIRAATLIDNLVAMTGYGNLAIEVESKQAGRGTKTYFQAIPVKTTMPELAPDVQEAIGRIIGSDVALPPEDADE